MAKSLQLRHPFSLVVYNHSNSGNSPGQSFQTKSAPLWRSCRLLCPPMDRFSCITWPSCEKWSVLSTLCKDSFLTYCLIHVLQAGSPADVLCPGLPASAATDLFPTALNVSCQIFRKLRIPWLPFSTGQSILTTRHVSLLFQLRSSPFPPSSVWIRIYSASSHIGLLRSDFPSRFFPFPPGESRKLRFTAEAGISPRPRCIRWPLRIYHCPPRTRLCSCSGPCHSSGTVHICHTLHRKKKTEKACLSVSRSTFFPQPAYLLRLPSSSLTTPLKSVPSCLTSMNCPVSVSRFVQQPVRGF